MTKAQVVKKLVHAGYGMVRAIEIYNMLSANGFYEVTRKDLNDYINK